MALQNQTFTAFPPAMYGTFINKIKLTTGVVIDGNSGTVEHGSFTFTYLYDAANETLQIQCLKKPLFIPASTITNGIAEEVEELRMVPVSTVA